MKNLLLLLMLLSVGAFAEKKKIILIAGKDSHGPKAHNWTKGAKLLAKALNEQSGLDVKAEIYSV